MTAARQPDPGDPNGVLTNMFRTDINVSLAPPATLAEIDMAHILEAELVGMIVDIGNGNLRGKKVNMGVSEAGNPCSIAIIHKLAKDKKPAGYSDGWAAQVGTATHAYLEAGIRAHPANQGAQPRYLLEHEVTVGQVDGVDITGTADLFDIDAGLVCDWKVPGPSPMMGYKSKGPGPTYRVQAQLYGRGFALLGFKVNTVMIAFLPRVGELGSPKLRVVDGEVEWANRGKRFFWSEPYDEAVGLAALSRLNGLAQLLKVMDKWDLIDQFEKCDQFFCPWCNQSRRR